MTVTKELDDNIVICSVFFRDFKTKYKNGYTKEKH